MEEILFKNKYRIESTRLPYWDYSSPGHYFITICTKYFVEYFGKVENGAMTMNEWGQIVMQEWMKTPQIRPNVELDEWVVMPNHIHGIIVVNGDPVETSRGTSLSQTQSKIHMYSGSIGSMINHFKGACTARIRKICPEFSWQPRFYDHVIRDHGSLDRIRQYIRNNPIKWEIDRNNDFMRRM